MSDIQMSPAYRVGIDVGGTFTDLLMADQDGRAVIGKTLTTPDDPAAAVEAELRRVLLDAGLGAAAELRDRDTPAHGLPAHGPPVRGTLVHGTTLVTNTLIERAGPLTALLTTAGFRDALEIGREHRYDLYDLNLEFPRPLVPRHLRFGVPERIAADGTVLEPLDDAYVERLVAELRDKRVRAIGVCYLHAFRNPAHERRTAEIIAGIAPQIRVSISSEVAPEIREFQRASTTVANVYVQERVGGYLDQVQQRLGATGFQGNFYVMLSSGGIGTVETAARFPVRLLESGPAAGALAAAALGSRAGFPDLLSFDMGGTTAKLCAVEGGAPLKVHEFEVDRVYRFRRGSGLPMKIPVIDMIEIGAGGGSIAERSSLGLLRVGPESAGAEPGPACYGRGGTAATVTDADLVLGYLDPAYFLGGDMRLDVEAARPALIHLGERLGLSVEETAWGIHQIVNENMANAARAHLAERGKDPRRMPLFAFGGAGPVHACRLAESLGLPAVIVPLGAGVGSTFGLLAAPLAFDFARSTYARLDQMDWALANALLEEMVTEGRALLQRASVAFDEISVSRTAEMRYTGQGHEVNVALPAGPLDARSVPAIIGSFDRAYEALYARRGPDVPVEILNWRVTCSGPRPALDMRLPADTAGEAGTASVPAGEESLAARHPAASRARKGVRPAYFPEYGQYAETPVLDRYALASGETFTGPAIIEERESTLVIGPTGRARVDAHRNVIVEFADRQGS